MFYTKHQTISMALTVTKLSHELIIPCEPTPTGTLDLSWLDRYKAERGLIKTLHVFKHGEDPAKVIKQALSKALVSYYPLAGRFVEDDSGELCVSCSGEGVWFVEASADCSLEDVDYLANGPLSSAEELLLHPNVEPREESEHLVMLQVTTFTCGGFAVGLVSSHAITDGLGTAQLLTAIAGIARGLDRPLVDPVWSRESIPGPRPLQHHHLSSLPPRNTFHMESLNVDLPLSFIDTIKDQFLAETNGRCSTFDASVAKLWQSRTQSANLDPDLVVSLCFTMNTRHLMKGLMPSDGYYGNCVYNMTISAKAGTVAEASVVEVVKMIRAGKERLPDDYSRFIEGKMEGNPYLGYRSNEILKVTDWSRVGFFEVDYGWGVPVHVMPLMSAVQFPFCVLVKPPEPMKGVRLITKCVNKEQLKEFYDRMMNLA